MLKIIGNTPLVKIRYKYKQKINYIYAKLESYNLTGSIKDRVAYYIITKAKERGDLKEEMPIIEATSGNTGISLAALGKYYKHPVYIFMPDWVSRERAQIIKSYGAEVITFSQEQGGFERCIKEAKNLAKRINGLFANQFANTDNLLSQYAIDIEVESTDTVDGLIDAIIKANENLKQSNENNNWEMIGKDMGKLQELINKLEVLVEEESKNEIQDVNELIENNIINDVNEAVE